MDHLRIVHIHNLATKLFGVFSTNWVKAQAVQTSSQKYNPSLHFVIESQVDGYFSSIFLILL